MPTTRNSLLLRLRTGADATCWDEFVDVYEPFLRGHLRRRGVPEHDAADLVQDVFVRLLRSIPGFEYQPRRGRFRDWLLTISRNVETDWRRRMRRRRTAPLAGLDVAFASSTHELAEWDAAHQRRVFEHALDVVRLQVTDKAWTCFKEYVIDGRSAAETAGELGLQTGSVYVIAARVKERLRRKCLQFDEEIGNGNEQLSA